MMRKHNNHGSHHQVHCTHLHERLFTTCITKEEEEENDKEE